jgi:hypothetical protein
MLKLKDVDANLSSRIKDDEVMSFHLTGCTGHYGNLSPVARGSSDDGSSSVF